MSRSERSFQINLFLSLNNGGVGKACTSFFFCTKPSENNQNEDCIAQSKKVFFFFLIFNMRSVCVQEENSGCEGGVFVFTPPVP